MEFLCALLDFLHEDLNRVPTLANAFKKPQECETSYDCDAPMVCCDLIVASVCCSGGQRSNNQEGQMQGQLIPIPVEVDKPLPGDPRGGSTPPQYPNGF